MIKETYDAGQEENHPQETSGVGSRLSNLADTTERGFSKHFLAIQPQISSAASAASGRYRHGNVFMCFRIRLTFESGEYHFENISRYTIQRNSRHIQEADFIDVFYMFASENFSCTATNMF